MTLDRAWLEPTKPWNAKVARAWEHVESLHAQVSDYRGSQPYNIKPESAGVPNRLAYRLEVWRPQPISISTTVGDIVHNLRSALDNLAYGLALWSNAGMLTGTQERRSTFPICATMQDFDQFFSERPAGLFNEPARAALREAQPFRWYEQAAESGAIAAVESFGEQPPILANEFTTSLLHRLNKLWNIDKHRRLVPAEWLLRDFWWSSSGLSMTTLEEGDGRAGDGAILFYMIGDNISDVIYHHLNLVLIDDPAFNFAPGWSEDVVTLMEKFHNYVDSIIRKTAHSIGSA